MAVSVSTCTSAFQLLQTFLMRDAEVLLLVDDQQAKVGLNSMTDLASSAWVPMTISICAGRPARRAPPVRVPGRRPAATAGRMLAPGSPSKRALNVRVVLAGQQGRRHHHRHLHVQLSAVDEGGAQRHLGLAEADIAADQPVHGLAGREARHRVVDGTVLVIGLAERKRAQNSSYRPGRRCQLRGMPEFAFGGQRHQLVRHLRDAVLEPARAVPASWRCPAVQLGAGFLRP